MTLLDIVQSTMSAMGSDLVNSLGDTEEAKTVALIAKEVFYEEMAYGDWPHLQVVTKLESISDVNRPTTLKIPDDVEWVDNLRYEVTQPGGRRRFKPVTHIPDANEFLEKVQDRDSEAANIAVVETAEGVPILVYNDRPPSYWTSFDNTVILFDAYDTSVGSTLVAANTSVRCKRIPQWSATETFYPPIPANKFPQFLAAVKERAFEYIKQTVTPGDISANRRLRTQSRLIGGRTHVQHSPRTFGRK